MRPMERLTPRRVVALLLGAAISAPLGAAARETPPPASAAPPQAQCRVRLDSFVGVHYRGLPKLLGWASTARVVRQTLAQWFPQFVQGQAVADGSPEELDAFLRQLPGPVAADVSIVYLASQQAADGSWAFVNGQGAPWSRIITRARPIPVHPRRIVIVDACYAAILEDVPGWRSSFPGPVLFAASRREQTFELRLDTRQPLDFKRRAPEAWAWSHRSLPDWDGRLSFLGLAWMQASRSWQSGPRDLGDWEAFLGDCCAQGAAFKDTVGRRWGSTLSRLGSEPPASGVP